ncbi:MAG: 4-alpha-glucanotransferase [Opitutaceae bacterium]
MPEPNPTWLDTRTAGVLAHVSALPGAYGIGNLGAGARGFVDFLAGIGFRHWQICPIGPTGYGDSPYQLFSSFAGNPYFIDLGELREAGLLTDEELAPLRALPERRADYGRLHHEFRGVLAHAAERFAASGADACGGYGSFSGFRRMHAAWLEPFAGFMGLKAHFGGGAWPNWPRPFPQWSADLLDSLPEGARAEAARRAFYQYVFFGQWRRLRAYAAERRVEIVGDVPIFVALDSADVWQRRSVFRLDHDGRPLAVAGVPPDYFSELGQLWGNPLYDWDRLRAEGYHWWIERLRAAFALYDIVRLDHFRGFDTYWEIPAGSADARSGRWRAGPGAAFFEAVRAALPGARIIAEDLGYIRPEVAELRRACGLPGMKVLQFGYGHDANNANLPHFCPPDSVVYPGTHDNLTTRGWLEGLRGAEFARVDDYFRLGGSRSSWGIVRAAFAAVSRLAVVPIQDLLDLPAEASFNRPGMPEGNWQWRLGGGELEQLHEAQGALLRHWIRLYDRTGGRPVRDYSEPPGHAAAPAAAV